MLKYQYDHPLLEGTGTYRRYQCCGSKYIEFGFGSRILAQFGSGSMVMIYQFWKKKFKIILKKNYLLDLSIQNKMSVEWITELIIYILSYTFCLYFILFLNVWIGFVFWIRIRIHKAPGYGSNTDPAPVPDLQHCYVQSNFYCYANISLRFQNQKIKFTSRKG